MEEETLRGKAPAAAGGPKRPSPSPARFTPLELAAAEQLIHLSESSSSGAAFTPRGGGPGPASAAASASSSSSPRSVNAPAAPEPPRALVAAGDDEDEQEVGALRRRNKRYRPIAEIYAATVPKPIGARGGRKDRPRPAGAAKELAPRK
ncbi:uncharacterized protein LOC133899368 [Phragmites australis]|uniref:uncharacterized protein LOC133899368 n=1 Tax=Phragmites australis TaxID=29695 RepID=UPI002D77E76B|nr:uncharacterized protein LOC133899368 [Phragmites australis]